MDCSAIIFNAGVPVNLLEADEQMNQSAAHAYFLMWNHSGIFISWAFVLLTLIALGFLTRYLPFSLKARLWGVAIFLICASLTISTIQLRTHYFQQTDGDKILYCPQDKTSVVLSSGVVHASPRGVLMNRNRYFTSVYMFEEPPWAVTVCFEIDTTQGAIQRTYEMEKKWGGKPWWTGKLIHDFLTEYEQQLTHYNEMSRNERTEIEKNATALIRRTSGGTIKRVYLFQQPVVVHINQPSPIMRL